MKTLIITLVVLVIVGLGAYYLFFNNGPSATPTPSMTNNLGTVSPTPTMTMPTASPTATPKASSSKTPTPSVTSSSVNISSFAFSPSSLVVKRGTRVTWTNHDSVAHTVTGDNGGPASSTINPSGTYSFTFNAVGTFPYHCSIHPSMTGTVTVTN